ncbi:amidohydrolase [Rhizobium puerariae]|uniref:Amidohydrolase n=1 Tax=Rhizobium puerariae TaxID=1585791 RepID=A0ABV6APB6_9HYPH
MTDIIQWVEREAVRFGALADEIWSLAETRFEEFRSAAILVEALRAEGFTVTTGLSGMPTAFLAEYGTDGPIAGFLGEYDALAMLSQQDGAAVHMPIVEGGNGHGCGHNLLGVGALMAAVALKNHLQSNELPGRVRYYGCPAEEGGSGKVFMARDGLFNDLDFALTWHPGPAAGLKSYPGLAITQSSFRFLGRAAHASWAPHLGRSALDAVELMNVGVNFLREHMPPDSRVHYAITNAGGAAANVVQAEAEVLYVVRSPNSNDANALFDRVIDVAKGAARMTGTELEIKFGRATSNILLNDELENMMYRSLEEIGPVPFDDDDRAFATKIRTSLTEEDVSFYEKHFGAAGNSPLFEGLLPHKRQNLAGTTDVGDVSWIVPTGQFWGACFAIGTPFHTWQLVAQGKSSAAHKGMVHAAKAMALTAAKMLQAPETILAAKQEHERRRGGKAYDCPIPANVAPPAKAGPELMHGAGPQAAPAI